LYVFFAMRPLPLLAPLLAWVALGAPVATAAVDPAAREADCATLFGGTVNSRDLVPASEIPEAGSTADWPVAPAGLLPQTVALRGPTETFNGRYQFATRDGALYVRRASGAADPDGWRQMPLPPCLDGRVASISADDDELIAVDADRRVFVMDNALKGPALFNWTRRWGMPFWTGPGRTLPDGVIAWSWSVLSPAEDRTWTDDAGNAHGVGNDKVSHIWALRTGGQQLTFMDPWLPNDDSYAMCAPRDGRFRSVNLSASGSTVFVVGRHGDLYTRLFDFDLSGSDGVFFDYSYEPQRGGDPQAPIQLPSPAWVHQPKVPGRISSAISVSKVGTGTVHRTLRVEGVDARGHTGYWEKDIVQPRSADWRFHRTDRPLSGPLLHNDPARDTSARDFGPRPGVSYHGVVGGVRVAVDGFDPHCTPSRLTLSADGHQVALVLHSVDGMRGEVRPAQLDDRPRGMYGDIEVPRRVLATLDHQPAAIRRLIAGVLHDARFTDVPLTATAHELTFGDLGWTLRR
jgi:hypothetical protein